MSPRPTRETRHHQGRRFDRGGRGRQIERPERRRRAFACSVRSEHSSLTGGPAAGTVPQPEAADSIDPIACANLPIVRLMSLALDNGLTAFPSQDAGAIGAVALDRRTTAYDQTASTAFQRRIFQPSS